MVPVMVLYAVFTLKLLIGLSFSSYQVNNALSHQQSRHTLQQFSRQHLNMPIRSASNESTTKAKFYRATATLCFDTDSDGKVMNELFDIQAVKTKTGGGNCPELKLLITVELQVCYIYHSRLLVD